MTQPTNPLPAAVLAGARATVVTSNGRKRFAVDVQTLAAFYEHGRHNLTNSEIAKIYGVGRNTVWRFRKNNPAIAESYENGKSVGIKQRTAFVRQQRDGDVAAPDLAMPAGGICEACGHANTGGGETITLTAAALAQAEKDFDALLDRYIAAGEASRAETPPRPDTKGARRR